MEQIYFDIAKAIKENPIAMSSRTQFRGLLSDYQMDKLHMNLLLTGYDASLHLYLRHDIEINGADYTRHRKNLVEHFGITEENAYWIVNTWVEMYAVEVLGKDVTDFMITRNIVDALRNIGKDDIHEYPVIEIKDDIPTRGKVSMPEIISEPRQYGTDEPSLEELELSVRAYNCLKRTGINTISEFIEVIKEYPMSRRLARLGRKSFNEIIDKIRGYNPSLLEEYDKLCEERKQADGCISGDIPKDRVITLGGIGHEELILSQRKTNCLKRLISGCDVGDCIHDDDTITVTYKGVEKQALLYRVNLLIENKSNLTLNIRAFDIQLDDIVVAQNWSITEHLHGDLKSLEKFSFTIDNVEKAGITDPFSKVITFKIAYSKDLRASNYDEYDYVSPFIKVKMR